jgi:biopolymer transport protein ExbB
MDPLVFDWWLRADVVVRAVFLVLIACSLASWTVTFYKLGQWLEWRRHERRARRSLANRDLDAFDRDSFDKTSHAPSAQLWNEAQNLMRLRRVSAAELQDRLDDVQSLIRLDQERYLTLLATIGSSAPFVGLLGTVWGIMHALQTMQGAELSLEAVAGPVGEALVATAVGLFAAIPALIAYNLLAR